SVHAGAVADDGAVIAFPGESGRGKSTLVAACVGAGLDYVSDEALLVDHETATVVPYPKPIQLDARSLQLLGRAELADNRDDDEDDVFVSAQSIGGAAATTDPPLRLRHVVVPTVDAATGTPELRPLSRSHILVALLRASFNHHLAPEQAFDLVHRLADGARAWKLRIGDPNEAAELIATQLARPGPAAGSAP
ncbi:MAG: hypothetical protein OEU32_07660, partial [Acidimicrobiia bacterium]|nr:hypothetical protein [Acidimicrobiia bacterium]